MTPPLKFVADHAPTLVDIEPLLTAEQVARILGVRAKRVYELGIPRVQVSTRTLRWSRSAVEAWIAARSGAA